MLRQHIANLNRRILQYQKDDTVIFVNDTRDMLVGALLPKSEIQSINDTTPKSQFDTLNCTLEELAVLRAVNDNPKITQTEIAKAIKKSASTVKRITSSLVEKGLLIRKNGCRNGWWEIKSDE